MAKSKKKDVEAEPVAEDKAEPKPVVQESLHGRIDDLKPVV